MLPRFRHILVPLDFDPKNQGALDIAIEVAQVNSARVTLLHVIEGRESRNVSRQSLSKRRTDVGNREPDQSTCRCELCRAATARR